MSKREKVIIILNKIKTAKKKKKTKTERKKTANKNAVRKEDMRPAKMKKQTGILNRKSEQAQD